MCGSLVARTARRPSLTVRGRTLSQTHSDAPRLSLSLPLSSTRPETPLTHAHARTRTHNPEGARTRPRAIEPSAAPARRDGRRRVALPAQRSDRSRRLSARQQPARRRRFEIVLSTKHNHAKLGEPGVETLLTERGRRQKRAETAAGGAHVGLGRERDARQHRDGEVVAQMSEAARHALQKDHVR